MKLEILKLINTSKSEIKSNVEICEKEKNEVLNDTHRKIRENIELEVSNYNMKDYFTDF